MRLIFSLFFILIISKPAFCWRSFSKFYCGADAIGIGTAYVGDASSESGVIYNPAGIVQLFKNERALNFSYEIFSTFKLIDVLAWNVDFKFDVFPFFFAGFIKDRYGVSLSIENLYYSPETGTQFFARFLKLTASYLLLDNLSIGLSAGPLIISEINGNGSGWGWQFGALYKPMEVIQIGANFTSSMEVTWNKSPYGRLVYERFPSSFTIGTSCRLTRELFFYVSLENSFYNWIRFIVDEKDLSPLWIDRSSLFIKPAFGIRFLEKLTGGHISLGVLMDHNLTEDDITPQYFITAGFRGYGRNFKYYLSIMDGFIIKMLYNRNIPRENINITFSFSL